MTNIFFVIYLCILCPKLRQPSLLLKQFCVCWPTMKCPFCNHLDNRVLDSRISKEGDITRRRRECFGCAKRFTTYERIEEVLPWVVKKDGRREAFDRLKISAGIKRACEKRPISVETIDEMISEIERHCQDKGEREVKSDDIGNLVMKKLKALDEVAYVRFASVYREFKDISEFVSELKQLKDKDQGEPNTVRSHHPLSNN